MLTDESTYRELRSIIDKQINDGKYISKDGSLDFNEALKDSIIQKSFLEYLSDSIKKDKETPYYDYYIKAYTTLDMLGVVNINSPKNIGLETYSMMHYIHTMPVTAIIS